MSKQQARLMGFALVMTFAALRAMADQPSTPLHQDHLGKIISTHSYSLGE